MFRKTVALVTVLSLICSSLVPAGNAQAAVERDAGEETSEPGAVRTIVSRDESWAIMDVRSVSGKLVIVSPVVGREIDFEESNRFAIFHGRNKYNRGIELSLLNVGIPGFQSAVFLKRDGEKADVRIRFRSGPRIESRLFPLEGLDDLRRTREYIEHFAEIQRAEYEIGKTSRIEPNAEYPKTTDELISFEQRVPKFALLARTPGRVALKNGDRLSGEFVPFYENDRILLQTEYDSHQIAVEDIQRLILQGNRGSWAAREAVTGALGGAAAGALVGALSAWQSGGSVREWATFCASFFAAAGFVTGLMRGARSAQGDEEFVLGPLPDRETGKAKKRDR